MPSQKIRPKQRLPAVQALSNPRALASVLLSPPDLLSKPQADVMQRFVDAEVQNSPFIKFKIKINLKLEIKIQDQLRVPRSKVQVQVLDCSTR